MRVTHTRVESLMEKLRTLAGELKSVMEDSTSDDWKDRYTGELEVFYEVYRTMELLEVVAAPEPQKE